MTYVGTHSLPLTYAGVGPEEAEAQLGLARIMLDDLLARFRECEDCQRDLPDRVREINEVLVAAVAAMHPARRGDGGVREPGRICVHGDSPSVGGPEASTVGALGGASHSASPSTPAGGAS